MRKETLDESTEPTLIVIGTLVIYCNPAALCFFGFHDHTDYLGKRIMDLFRGSEFLLLGAQVQLATTSGETISQTYNFKDGRGYIFPAEIHTTAFASTTGYGVELVIKKLPPD